MLWRGLWRTAFTIFMYLDELIDYYYLYLFPGESVIVYSIVL